MKRLLAIVLLLSPLLVTADETKKKQSSTIAQGEEALVGYWAVDEDFIFQMMLKDAGTVIEEGKVTKEQLKKEASKYSEMMLIHFSAKKTSTMHTVAGDKEGTYKITSKRPEKNEIDISINSEKFSTEKSTLVVKGDGLTMAAEKGGQTVQFKRVSQKNAPGRIQYIKELSQKK